MEMRVFLTCLVLAACCGPKGARAQLEVVAKKEPQCVFGGHSSRIALLCSNTGNTTHEADIRMHLMQLTTATAAPVNEAPWKRLQVLSGQTVVETAALEFPAVKAKTRFLVQWIEDKKQVVGTTEIHVYPTNLFAELQPLVGHEDGALGILDPENRLKPLLKNCGVDFVDLGSVELEKFRGKLAIIGPIDSKIQMDPHLAKSVKIVAEHGVAVVWLQPPVGKTFLSEEQLVPSFYSVLEYRAAVIIAQAHMVTDLSENPRSQLDLISFCKMALFRQPLAVPFWQTQPQF
jgi:hypothetical protein